jgi:hypothetical protein
MDPSNAPSSAKIRIHFALISAQLMKLTLAMEGFLVVRVVGVRGSVDSFSAFRFGKKEKKITNHETACKSVVCKLESAILAQSLSRKSQNLRSQPSE